MPLTLIWHGCEHEYQDKKFGKNMRAMNPTAKDGVYRCTVCGNEVIKSKGTKTKAKQENKK